MICSAVLRGVRGHVVHIQASQSGRLPTLRITGLAVAAERETRVRVTSALATCRHEINATPHVTCDGGGVTIDGTGLDLAIALAVACGDTRPAIGALAELSLNGDLRPVRGVLAAVEELREHVRVVIVAPENAAEAALVDGVRIVIARRLSDAIEFASGRASGEDAPRRPQPPAPPALDLRDIKGAAAARRAIEITAAGGHHVLFLGGPGAGKTMFARRLPGILPALTHAEQLEVTRVHSAAGLNIGGGLIAARPFRAPHHSTTPPGLIGGGATLPRPGEASLAHRGVLFLDDLPEFSRAALEMLCEPVETGEVALARASGTLRFPTRCTLFGTMAACPCGRFPGPQCRCAATDRARYTGRVHPRLLGLFDVRVSLPVVDVVALEPQPAGEDSATVAERVANARAFAVRERATDSDVMSGPARSLLARAVESSLLPSRQARDRVARVARTIANLAQQRIVSDAHVAEAIDLGRDPF